MDKKHVTPIFAERDNMMAGPITHRDGATDKSIVDTKARDFSGLWATLAVLIFIALAGIGYFAWMQYQDLQLLQDKFNELDLRLNSTDESILQSDATLQVSVSRNKDALNKQQLEIKELREAANNINRKIVKNTESIASLTSKSTQTENSLKQMGAKIDLSRQNLARLSANDLEHSAMLDSVNKTLRQQADGLNRIQISLNKAVRKIDNNAQAVDSIDGFRRQVSQKLFTLENWYYSHNWQETSDNASVEPVTSDHSNKGEQRAVPIPIAD